MAYKKNEISKEFDKFVEDYLNDLYRSRPATASFVGIHDYDREIEDFSTESIKYEIDSVKSYQNRLSKLDRSQLEIGKQIDHKIVENQIRARLLSLEEIRPFESNPYIYCETLSDS